MTTCPHCSAQNLEGAKFCASCGEPMQPPAPAYPSMRGMAPAATPAPEPHYPSMRGMAPVAAPVPEPHYASMRGMAAEPAQAGQRFATGKTPGLAMALCFFFPGGGQFYNGDTKKGFAIFGVAVLAAFLTIEGVWVLGVPLNLANLIWAMLDAGKVARRQKAMW